MTPDELTVVVATDAALYVADRSKSNQAFTPQALTLPEGYEASSGAALSSDGLQLVLVSADHGALGEVSRSSRDEPFGTDVDTSRFATINGLKETTGRSLGWPVLSSDGRDLYYLSYFGQGLVAQSHAGEDGVFAYGDTIDEFTLGGEVGEYKLLTGISADQRAIFFFDEASGHSMALFRSREGAPFYDPLDLGEREGVAPNATCSRLYSSVLSGIVAQATQ
jgi:hypothetical protein